MDKGINDKEVDKNLEIYRIYMYLAMPMFKAT